MKSAMIVIATVLTLGGCSTEPEAAVEGPARAAATSNELSPESLAELGARIEKEPERAGELLAAQGLDEKSFEQAIRRVTEDPDASRRYAEAYRRMKG